MKHLTDGQIRAALDSELDEAGNQHLKDCPDCQQRMEVMQNRSRQLQQKLSFLVPGQEKAGPSAYQALVRYNQKVIEKKEKSMFQKLFASRILRLGIGVAVLLALVLSVPSTRAWAGEFLGLFRVQQVTILPIDSTGLEQLSGNPTMSKQMSQMFSQSVTFTQKPGSPKTAASAAEASAQAGFTVRLPQNAPSTPDLTTSGSMAFQIKVDRARAQALLDEAGRKDLVLPASIDGAEIGVNIPASIRAAYGTCPPPEKASASEIANGSAGRKYPDCIILEEIPSPTVNTPPNMNIQQLAEIGLEFTGMTPEQAQTFSQTVDWTSSLVIPIPKNAATYKQVTVDGVTGTLIERPVDDAPEFLLIWVKNGIVYAIGGLGNRADQAMQMANDLQ